MFVSPPGIGGYLVVSWLDWMRASYGKAISVAILLFTLAPLGSLYVLLFSFGLNTSSTESGSGIYEMDSSKQESPQQQATLELVHQVFSALFVGGSPQLMQMNLAAASSSASSSASYHHQHHQQHIHSARNEHVSMPHSPLVLASKLFPGKVQTIHHLSVVLPWLLTFCLGVLVPAGLSLYSFYRQYQRNNGLGPFSSSQQHRRSHYKRLKKSHIHKKLLAHSHVLRNRDRGRTKTQSKQDKKKNQSMLLLQRAPSPPLPVCSHEEELSLSNHEYGDFNNNEDHHSCHHRHDEHRLERNLYGASSFDNDNESLQDDNDENKGDEDVQWHVGPTRRSIPGTCAICLHAYQTRDHVCWSPNPDCVHAFHLNCMVSWLVCRQKQSMQTMEGGPKMDCPCCRQDFLTAEYVHVEFSPATT